MNVYASEYLNKVAEQAAMKVSVLITVLETGQKHAKQDDFRLRTPDMNVEVRDTHMYVQHSVYFSQSVDIVIL